jgi:hypothetical protein
MFLLNVFYIRRGRVRVRVYEKHAFLIFSILILFFLSIALLGKKKKEKKWKTRLKQHTKGLKYPPNMIYILLKL